MSVRLIAKAIGAKLLEPRSLHRQRSSAAGFLSALTSKSGKRSGRRHDFFSRLPGATHAAGVEGENSESRQTAQFISRGGRVIVRPTADCDGVPGSRERPKPRVSFADQQGIGTELQQMASRRRSEKL